MNLVNDEDRTIDTGQTVRRQSPTARSTGNLEGAIERMQRVGDMEIDSLIGWYETRMQATCVTFDGQSDARPPPEDNEY